jgi:hypothetical protein
MTQREPDWQVYERIVAAMQAEGAGMEHSVTPNAKIRGCITGILRQIDVLVDARWADEDLTERVIVDAKMHRSKVDVKDIEAFEGMMKDCRANRGIIVCANGYTPAAKRRAQDAITITLLPAENIEEFPWSQFDRCMGSCSADNRIPHRGLVLWDGQLLLGMGSGWAIVWSGKCDRCYNFHAWCWDCGEKFALADEDEHECGCGRRWVTAIEEEPDGSEVLDAVHFFLASDDQVFAIDRRRCR